LGALSSARRREPDDHRAMRRHERQRLHRASLACLAAGAGVAGVGAQSALVSLHAARCGDDEPLGFLGEGASRAAIRRADPVRPRPRRVCVRGRTVAMTLSVAEFIYVTVALFVIVGGGVFLHAWWKARNMPPPLNKPRNGEWK